MEEAKHSQLEKQVKEMIVFAGIPKDIDGIAHFETKNIPYIGLNDGKQHISNILIKSSLLKNLIN